MEQAKPILIEAISLAVPGKGLRKSKLRHLCQQNASQSQPLPWGVYVEFCKGFEGIELWYFD